MPITIERRGATIGVRMPPEPDARAEDGRPLYIVDPAQLGDLRGAQRALRDGWGLEPHGSVPNSETLMYFRPITAQPPATISRAEWDELGQRVARLEERFVHPAVDAEERFWARVAEIGPVTVLPDQEGEHAADE